MPSSKATFTIDLDMVRDPTLTVKFISDYIRSICGKVVIEAPDDILKAISTVKLDGPDKLVKKMIDKIKEEYGDD